MWDYVNKSLISKIPVSGTITFILPANEKEKEVLDRLKSMPHVTVYRKEDIPDRLHYKNNPRIMPIVILADEGWTVTDVSHSAVCACDVCRFIASFGRTLEVQPTFG